jgi:hypothetical protein
MRVKRSELNEYYKQVLRLSSDDLGRLVYAEMRRRIKPYLMLGQSDVFHLNTLLKRCLAESFIVMVGRGRYRLTELGADWCGAANVAKPS